MPSLVALYRLAHFCVVSSLHDGMNLVAKEFVAARDDEDGVLVLSALAGAAQELREALIINPYDIDGFATVLERAIDMPIERAARADAGDAAHRGRPQRVRLGVGHPRGAGEPLDQAAAVRGTSPGRCAGLGVGVGSDLVSCTFVLFWWQRGDVPHRGHFRKKQDLTPQSSADISLSITSSTPSPASPAVTIFACAFRDGTALATATPNPHASRNA